LRRGLRAHHLRRPPTSVDHDRCPACASARPASARPARASASPAGRWAT
jgi:hypothetical protein